MSDLIGSPTVTPAPAVSNPTTSELAGFDIADVKAASRHTWSIADRLDPKTFQLLRDLTDEDRT